MSYFAKYVSRDRIPDGHRRFVQRHVDRLAAQHGLGRVWVRWFSAGSEADHDFAIPGDSRALAGSCPIEPGDYICLRADFRGPQVPLIIAHEIGHLIQVRTGTVGQDVEAEAQGYALEYGKQIGLVLPSAGLRHLR